MEVAHDAALEQHRAERDTYKNAMLALLEMVEQAEQAGHAVAGEHTSMLAVSRALAKAEMLSEEAAPTPKLLPRLRPSQRRRVGRAHSLPVRPRLLSQPDSKTPVQDAAARSAVCTLQ